MTHATFDDLSAADRSFALAARQRLLATEELNYVESARLAATRRQAVALAQQPASSLPAWGWLAAPALLAALTIAWLQPQLRLPTTPIVVPAVPPDLLVLAGDVNASSPSALEWGTDEAGLDFYRDLEFYEWLQSRSPAEPNA